MYLLTFSFGDTYSSDKENCFLPLRCKERTKDIQLRGMIMNGYREKKKKDKTVARKVYSSNFVTYYIPLATLNFLSLHTVK